MLSSRKIYITRGRATYVIVNFHYSGEYKYTHGIAFIWFIFIQIVAKTLFFFMMDMEPNEIFIVIYNDLRNDNLKFNETCVS